MNDEFAFISSITPHKKNQENLILGIGDDAALYRASENMEQVVCVDSMAEGVHFQKDTMKAYHIGYKALASNLSDLAAMGAIPKYYLVSIAISPSWNEQELRDIYHGMADLAESFKMDLIGGDTVSTKNDLVISVTVIGEVEKNRHLLRSEAKKGDIVFVTGSIGNAAAGLEILFKAGIEQRYSVAEEVLVKAHQMPNPQIVAGRILSESGCRVCLNDVSDGLASEANEISESSNVVIELNASQFPLSNEMIELFPEEQQLQYALFGGEDYQLVGTVAKSDWEYIKSLFIAMEIQITNIGVVKEGTAKVELIKGTAKDLLEKKGFNHFKREK